MPAHVLFSNILRCEHRKLLDACITTAYCLGRRDATQLRQLVRAVSQFAGRHVRSEEEAVCQLMEPHIGQEKMEQVLRGHDLLIDCVQKLSELAGAELTTSGGQEGVRLLALMARALVDCDSLTHQLGRMSDEEVKAAMAAHSRSMEEDLDLLTWADCMRQRPSSQAEASSG